ncbi:MAG TPA: TonB-dependent receptor plug domain-containing protein [Pseudohongiella sp.]|nr:TonB-dependent receptor plug domain-containing protein [Pseudohongiella sp.]
MTTSITDRRFHKPKDKKLFNHHLLFWGVLTALYAADSQAQTQEIQEVLVTSRNRVESAQDVPLPVLVLSDEDIRRENVVNIWDLPERIPNLQLNNPGENARKVSPGIRGLGRGGANDSMEQSVGVIVDDVTLYYSGQAWADYVDVERIEVLRGPQGTLLGKNTSLGAIKIVTKQPEPIHQPGKQRLEPVTAGQKRV